MNAASVIYGFIIEPDDRYSRAWCESAWKELGFRQPLYINSSPRGGAFDPIDWMILRLRSQPGWNLISTFSPEDAVDPVMVIGVMRMTTEDVVSFEIDRLKVAPQARNNIARLARLFGAEKPSYVLLLEEV